MITTNWKVYDNGLHRICCAYGFDLYFAKKHNQEPYFSITGETQRLRVGASRWSEDSFGCLHDLIAEHFPELSALIRWHLCGAFTGPMHYVENGVFWWEIATGRRERGQYDPNPMKAFESTIVLGAVDGEAAACALVDDASGVYLRIGRNGATDWIELRTEADVRAFLERRLPALLAQMRTDMTSAGVAVSEALPPVCRGADPDLEEEWDRLAAEREVNGDNDR